MRISVHHRTSYRYEMPATYAAQLIRLTPSDTVSQKVVDWQISAGLATLSAEQLDGFGNRTRLLTLDQAHNGLVLEVSGVVETVDGPGQIFPQALNERISLYQTATVLSAPFPALVTDLGKFSQRPLDVSLAEDLMHWARDRVDYVTGVTHVATKAEEAYKAGHGVCQDHAHVYLAAARFLGLPARYISGYLWASDDPGETYEAAHAWVEVFLDGSGWHGFDVANRCQPDGRYIRLAQGRDYQDAAPVRGTRRGGSEESLEVEVTVQAASHQQ